ncbi:hypothetical protein CL654_00610 [bacterium]|nr:hypothetical protein [bacterium]
MGKAPQDKDPVTIAAPLPQVATPPVMEMSPCVQDRIDGSCYFHPEREFTNPYEMIASWRNEWAWCSTFFNFGDVSDDLDYDTLVRVQRQYRRETIGCMFERNGWARRE